MISGHVAVGLIVGAALACSTLVSSPAQAAGACLTMPLVFETRTAQGCPDAASLESLMDAPLPIGPRSSSTGVRAGVTLTDAADDTTTRSVRACRDYADLTRQGWYAATQMEMNFEGFMRVACGSLFALAASNEATISRFDAEAVGFQTLSLLPPDILPALAPDTEDALATLKSANFSVGNMVATGDVLTRSGAPEQLELAYAGSASTYGEVARGDFNGDGEMDLLVYARHEAVSGSLRWYELFALAYHDGALIYERFEPAGLDQLDAGQ
ncbi:hypothetical protein [Pyruvatibacter sp.]|uniref:hypothetical protein n=1 Tax=Pyruvatibacter sp. TaxID=1981328 RepID=UPI0032EBA209